MSKTRWVLIVVGIAVLGALIARIAAPGGQHRPGAGPGASASGSSERVIPVMTVLAAQQDVPIVLEGLGTVTPVASVMVRSQVDGRLESVSFKEGQDVKKGDSLARIDARVYGIQLQSAQAGMTRNKAALELARANQTRGQALAQEGLLNKQDLDAQTAAVASASASLLSDQAAIAQARLMMDFAHIRSPIDGVTGVRLIDPGNLVRASDPTGIVMVTQLDPIAVLFALPQDDLPRIQKQLAAGVVVTDAFARDGQTRLATGQLALVDNQINTQTGTVRLKAIFPNPERLLWPNAFVKARLTLEVKKGALVVPAAAIQRGPAGTFVYVVAPDRTAVMKPVTVALMQGELAMLSDGVVAGDAVVVDGQAQLRPGGKVAPRGSGAPASSARPPRADEAGSPAGSGRPARPAQSGTP